MKSIGVVIGTYGNRVEWSKRALDAKASIKTQTCEPDDWVHLHGETLADARNRGAKTLDTDYLIFLDADDTLDSRYIEEMRNALVFSTDPWCIYRPATIGIYEDGTSDEKPVMIPRTDLKRANCIVIGAMCPTDIFWEVGGFGEWPALEDWALWRAMVAEGAFIKDVPHAVYEVHVHPDSRNQDQKKHGEVYRRILKEVPL